MAAHLELELVFRGKDADDSRLQFYDAAHALVGMERTISLTNHLLINGEVLSQSPSVSGFHTYLLPPEEGSWKAGIGIFFGAMLTVGVASKDSALGYLAVSALDYVLQQALGFEVDFNETLGPQIREAWENQIISQTHDEGRFDSLIEKVEPALRQCHRPIVFSESAKNGQIAWRCGRRQGTLDGFFDTRTYEYISKTIRKENLQDISGIVSSYNVNTFKGRLYVKRAQRTIPFELSQEARNPVSIQSIVGSLYENSSKTRLFSEEIILRGFRNESVNGRLKSLFVVDVNPEEPLS